MIGRRPIRSMVVDNMIRCNYARSDRSLVINAIGMIDSNVTLFILVLYTINVLYCTRPFSNKPYKKILCLGIVIMFRLFMVFLKCLVTYVDFGAGFKICMALKYDV